MRKKILIVMAAFLAVVAAGFGVWRYYLQKSPFTNSTTMINVGAEIESEGKSALMSAKGGSLELEGDNPGEVFTLILPENSLPDTETITIRNINSLNLPYEQWSFVSGVELTPDGTKLVNAGELTISIPEGVGTEDLSGFSFSAEGKDFFLYPITIKDSTATLKLSGFSGYGLINLGGYKPKTAPSEKSKQAKQLISDIVAEARSDQLLGHNGLDQGRLNKIITILEAWFKAEVSTKLKEAQNTEKMIDQAGFEYFNWLGVVQTFGLEGNFSKEIDTAQDLLAGAIKKGVEVSSQKCVSEKDATQASFMLHLYAFAEMTGLNGRQGLSAEDIKEKANKCAQFELKITSTFEHQCDSCDSPDIGKYSGTLPLKIDEGFNVSGGGAVNVDSYREMAGSEFEHGCTPTPSFAVQVHNTQLKVAGDKPSVSLMLSVKSPDDITYDCSYYIGGETLFKVTGSIGPDWDFEFWNMHEEELKKITEDDSVYLLNDWEIVNTEGIFARKVYQRSKHTTGGFGSGGTTKEDTVLELIHRPQ